MKLAGKIVRMLVALASVMALAGCVPQRQVLTNTTMFNPDEVSWSTKPGNNTVTGFAVLRTASGEARTCAALLVRLIPDSAYARERMSGIYGSLSQGTTRVGGPAYKEDATDKAYVASVRETRCDGQGNFTFESVPNGVWYVSASVVWSVNHSRGATEGGAMMKRIELTGGQTVKVSLP